jgi:hypothetical protein
VVTFAFLASWREKNSEEVSRAKAQSSLSSEKEQKWISLQGDNEDNRDELNSLFSLLSPVEEFLCVLAVLAQEKQKR